MLSREELLKLDPLSQVEVLVDQSLATFTRDMLTNKYIKGQQDTLFNIKELIKGLRELNTKSNTE